MGVQIAVPRTKYQVYSKKQSGRFSKSREGSIVKYILLQYLRTSMFFPFFCCSIVCLYLLCRVSARHLPWKSGGVNICLYILRTTLPCTWLLVYAVPVVSSSVCVLHSKPFFYS